MSLSSWGAGGGQQVARGEQWQLQPEQQQTLVTPAQWPVGILPEHGPGSGHLHGPPCPQVRCFSNRHTLSTGAQLITMLLSQLKTSSVTITGTDSKQRNPFLYLESRNGVSARDGVSEELF